MQKKFSIDSPNTITILPTIKCFIFLFENTIFMLCKRNFISVITSHYYFKKTIAQNCVDLNYCRLHLVCTGFLRLLFRCAACNGLFSHFISAELYFSCIAAADFKCQHATVGCHDKKINARVQVPSYCQRRTGRGIGVSVLGQITNFPFCLM